MELVFDFDFVKFAAAAVGEERSIRVTHPYGIDETFKNRTEFYGRAPKYEGGWLAQVNKHRKEDNKLQIHEFTIEDIQTLKPIENTLHTAKQMIRGVCERLGTNNYYGYVGKGDSWRVEASTLLKYKGQRAAMIRPLALNDVEEYLVKHHRAEYVEHLEADDQCVIDCYNRTDRVLVAIDKDACGVNNINLFNPDKYTSPVRVDGLGKLWLDDKGHVRGLGRKFFYFQVLSGDSSDNYFANCMSDITWGDKSAYKALVDCKTDQECWQAMKECYQLLYQEPKVVKGWRGDDIEVDWLYVLKENTTLAHMLRWEDDSICAEKIMNKLGVM